MILPTTESKPYQIKPWTRQFIEMWNRGDSLDRIAEAMAIGRRSVPCKARVLRSRGIPMIIRAVKPVDFVRFEDVKSLIDWREVNKVISQKTGLSYTQVQYYRSLQPAPLNQSPRCSRDSVLAQYPLVSDDKITLETLAKTYKLTLGQVRYATRKAGIPRSLKNYRKGRGL